jgi:aminoglycoside 2'-N-acetyltransferase I
MTTPTLRTSRLVLTPLSPDDAEEMAAVLADPALYAFTGGEPADVPATRARFERLAVGRSADDAEEWHNWIARLASTGAAVGSVQATVTRVPDAVGLPRRRAAIAWVIGVAWQGNGFATEAAIELVRWLASTGASTIEAYIQAGHAASEAVAARAGLTVTDELMDGERIWRRVTAARLRRLATDDLTATELQEIRALMDVAFGTGEEAFADADWQHALGGTHHVLDVAGTIVSHAAVVERTLEIDGRPLRTGYVEAVATAPDAQGEGLGSQVMEAATAEIRDRFELGALGTGRHAFYERLGWETWRGPAFARSPQGLERTPDDEGYVLVLRTPTSPPFELTDPISCDWRAGDVW